MNLIVDIAWTHVRARARQTVVAVVGVAIGVGFSIMMAALMQGSQDDFIRQLVNALPHITISDERREPPPQPAETEYAAVQIYGLTPETRRRGESARHHGIAGRLDSGRGRALGQGAGDHPLCLARHRHQHLGD
jgi:ABC-type lipoprotein release transport system permease subunit